MVKVKCHSQGEGSLVTESEVTLRAKGRGPNQELQSDQGFIV